MGARRAVALCVGTAALAHWLVLRKLLKRWNKKNYGGLESLVSFSSRLIAAARAVESLRPDAFVVDPLAWLLAGPKAMDRYKDDPTVKSAQALADTSKHTPASAQQTAASDLTTTQQQQQQVPEQRPVPRLIMRTCFFDDAALAAVGNPAHRSTRCLAALLEYMQQRGLHGCKQVVLLGSGMDTRPWRLDLPAGISWFEVDRQDVLTAKQLELTKAGVPFTQAHTTAANNGGSGSSTGDLCLKAASWSCAAADLQMPGWTAKLIDAGLDVSKPVAWLAEGLMYYLEPNCVAPMLQEAASISAPGSVFAANFLTAEGITLLQAKAAGATSARPQMENSRLTRINSHSSSRSNGSEGGPTTAVTTTDSASSGDPGSRRKGSGLMSQFKWGCPDDVEQFWATQGWNMLLRYSWRQAAVQYGWTPQVTSAAMDRPPSQEVQFAVAVVAEQ